VSFRSIGSCLLLTAGFTLTAHAQVTSGPQVDAVLAYLHAACAAYQRNDVAAIDSLVADGFILTDARGVTTTKADDLRSARERAIEFTAFRNEGMRAQLYGTTAVVTGRTIIVGKTKDGTALDIEVQFTDTVILLDGRWRIVASHVSRLNPKPS
jgi:ketosteroid isomerase-like protein